MSLLDKTLFYHKNKHTLKVCEHPSSQRCLCNQIIICLTSQRFLGVCSTALVVMTSGDSAFIIQQRLLYRVEA